MASDKNQHRASESNPPQDMPEPKPAPPPAPPPPSDPPAGPTPEQQAAKAAERAASSIGGQIILDYNGDGSLGARGGAGGTIEENTLARDAWLKAQGLDPVAPTGPPPTQEQIAAMQQQAEKQAMAAAAPDGMPAHDGKAGRMSSLAAGVEPAKAA